MGFLTLAEAAERLGVTKRQVQYLVAQGKLHAVARGVIDDVSVDRFLATQGESPARPWSEATAWAAIAFLEGQEASWLGQSQRWRLRARLRETAAGVLVGRARERAVAYRFAGHPSTAPRLRSEIVDTAAGTTALGLTDTTAVDGYASRDAINGLVARHGLVPDDAGAFTIRATDMAMAVVTQLAHAGTVLAALDLAESLNPRERHIGLRALDAALERFRD
ncbi:helix-turn-helix domain-containing protein [Dactylosporangium sp. CS-033363]|uniref:helix-turn-helix domain-containing protein n=1 Tax=Dactylosporangium sp. CS-033363 TaxID=3239935 RepID=UPI003D8BF5D6